MGETRQVVALDIGGTKIASALVTFKEGERPEVSLYGKVPTEAKRGGKVVLQHAIESVRRVIDAADGRVFGIGVSSGGVIDPATGNVTYANDMMPGWGGTHLGAELHAIFGVPVKVMNDVHAHAFGEAFWGAGFGKTSTLVCAVGTGIGGGIILNHEVFMGSSGGAGEFSWLTVDYPGVWQPLEYGNTSFQSIWSGLCSSLALIMGYQALTGKEHVDGITFFQDLHAGNETAEKVFDQFTSNMAAGISGLQAVLDLECYAIGGGISEEPIVRDAIAEKVDALWKLRPMMPYGRPSIVTTKYHNDANLIGALHLYLKKQNH